MEEIITTRTNLWIIFSDSSLLSKPICKVKTLNNNEEYYMGICLLKIGKYAVNENELIEKNIELPIYNLTQFTKKYAPN